MIVRFKSFSLNNTISMLIQLVFILLSLFCLKNTDSLYNVYVSVFMLGIFALLYNKLRCPRLLSDRQRIIYLFGAFLFSACILLAGYTYLISIITFGEIIVSCKNVFIIFTGSFCTAWNTLLMLDAISNKWDNKNAPYKLSLAQTALFCFCSIAIINLSYLFVFEYPGNLTPDSLNQISQLLINQYSNHHPFYHTMAIKACVSLGMLLFNDINAAVACFSVFQILFMASCFTFCVITLYQMKVPKSWLVFTVIFFALTPYHVIYSMTLWKDIPFGGAVLMLITSLFRLFNGIGKSKWLNWCCLTVGALGTCLWRSNGWIAFAFTWIVFLVCFAKKYKQIALSLTSILLVTYVMLHPVLAFLNVIQPDTIEALSIPAQQIARVFAEDGNISDDEYDLLNQIIDTSKIKAEYNPYISDAVKNLVRATNNQGYLIEHKLDYLKLWISIGLKNPFKYVVAWIDQTKGYWNGGYQYWIWDESVWDNPLGIQKADRSTFSMLRSLKQYALNDFRYSGAFDVLQSIGLCTWIVAVCCGVSLANKRGRRAFITVPLLAIVATLCIATPVYTEFRYAYALFTSVPFIICSTFYREENEQHG